MPIVEVLRSPETYSAGELSYCLAILAGQHGPQRVSVRLYEGCFLVLAGEAPELNCSCRTCDGAVRETLRQLGAPAHLTLPRGMIVCDECWNKRCPKATLHDLDCTGSNAPGQVGSVYA